MPRFAGLKDFDFVKNSWLVCFDDTQQFVDWNFEFNYSPQNTVIAETEGVCASVMQLMPYKLRIGDATLDARYVSGVATLPEYRGRGLVRDLFNFGLDAMYDMGAEVSILIPAVEGMYEKFGYRKISDRRFYTIDKKDGFKEIKNLSAELISQLDRIYKKEMKGKAAYIDRSYFDWERILTDLLKLSGGSVLSKEENGVMEGYALAYPKGERLEVCERCGEIALDAQEFFVPPIMARIINAQSFLKKVITNMSFCVKDNFIPRNNICVNGGGEEIDIGVLTEKIFNDLSDIYINLLL